MVQGRKAPQLTPKVAMRLLQEVLAPRLVVKT
jgi:hypothetical protein